MPRSARYIVPPMARSQKADRHPLFTTRVGDLTLTARCDPTLAEGARSLLAVVASFARRGHGLVGGVSLQFGWSRVTIVEQGTSLRLHEPDFDRGEGIRADLTASLRVAKGQASIARATGLAPTVATCFQHVTVVGGCLGERSVTMRRQDGTAPDDSGWILTRTTARTPSNAPGTLPATMVVPSGRLIAIRAALLDVLTLPVGHEVDFDGNTVIALRGLSSAIANANVSPNDGPQTERSMGAA